MKLKAEQGVVIYLFDVMQAFATRVRDSFLNWILKGAIATEIYYRTCDAGSRARERERERQATEFELMNEKSNCSGYKQI